MGQVILAAGRSAIGKFLGGLAPLSAPELAAAVFRHCITQADLGLEQIQEVILGHVISAGVGQAPARQAALRAGLPVSIPAYSVNKVCGSGLKAVMLAAQAIKAGDAQVVLAGGMESMSNAPHLLRKTRTGNPYGHGIIEDSLLVDGLECAFEKWHMGSAAEHIARRFKLEREAIDHFALESHRRACEAQSKGHFEPEIVPIKIPKRKGESLIVQQDEGPRADSSIEKLAKLPPVFEKQGCITAGNSSSLNDGAAAVLVADEAWAIQQKRAPLARILGYAVSGVEPKEIFHAPAVAIPMLLEKLNLRFSDIDLFELNEAFAAQALANINFMGIDSSRVNIFGGAIALGHPIGASGTRCLVTLLNALKISGGKRGVVSLCLGGGNAVAMAVEVL